MSTIDMDQDRLLGLKYEDFLAECNQYQLNIAEELAICTSTVQQEQYNPELIQQSYQPYVDYLEEQSQLLRELQVEHEARQARKVQAERKRTDEIEKTRRPDFAGTWNRHVQRPAPQRIYHQIPQRIELEPGRQQRNNNDGHSKKELKILRMYEKRAELMSFLNQCIVSEAMPRQRDLVMSCGHVCCKTCALGRLRLGARIFDSRPLCCRDNLSSRADNAHWFMQSEG